MNGSSVDNKVVSLKFDNAQFAAKVAETQGMLEKLKGNLNFSDATRSMGDLDRASKNVNLGPLGAAAEGVSAKFVAMATVAITALSNITNRAVDAGMKIVKALSVDPIMDGFREYETNMNSIQTVLANTSADGTNLEQVNHALEELNHYSDKTIYNFAEMARNVGTFTAAGVNLETSVGAIKGIANLAAVSGSSSQQASTAMYQLSQAIATGSVKLMDWNSVVNAGMGGEVFQKALFESGKAMGTLNDVPIDQTFEEWTAAGNSFRDSLQDGWITGEVLTNTLEGFTGDLTDAQLKSMGYTDAQIVEIQRMAAVAKGAATEVKTLTQLAGTVKEAIGSGWSQSFKLILGDFEEAKQLLTGVNTYISGVVGRSADARNEMLKTWKDFGGRATLIEALRTAFHGIMSIIKPIKDAFRSIFPKTTAVDLLNLTARFSEFAKKISIGAETAEKIKFAFSGLFSVFRIGWEIIKGVAGLIGDLFKALAPAGEGALNVASSFGMTLTVWKAWLVEGGAIQRFFDNLGEKIPAIVDKIKDFANSFKDLFGGVGGEGFNLFGDNLGQAGEDAESIGDRIRNAMERIKSAVQSVKDFVQPKIDAVIGYFQDFRERVKDSFSWEGTGELVKIGGILAIFLAIRQVIKKMGELVDEGTGILENVKDIFGGVTDTLEAMQLKLKADALMKIAIAVGVLTASVLVLSLIDPDALARALGAMAVGFGQLAAMMVALTKVDMTGAKLATLAVGMTLMAAAMLILAGAVKMFSSMEWEELARGLAGVAGGMAVLVGAVKIMGAETAGMVATGFGMLIMAVALKVMASAVKDFSDLDWEEMGRGLAGVAGAMAVLVGAVKIMGNETAGLIAAGFGMILMGAALKIVASAVKDFGSMDWETMKQGLIGAGLALAALALASNLMPPTLPLIGLGLIAVAAALKIMASAVKDLGEMEFETLKQGMIALAGTLAILAIATNLMSGAALGAASILLVALALKPLADVLEQLGKMSMGQIGGALLALAGALVILGLAAVGAGAIAPALIIMAGALLAIGAGFALIGAGAYLAARAFEIFSEAGGKAVEGMKELIKGFIDVLPDLAAGIATFVLVLAKNIIEGMPPVVKAIQELLAVIIEALIDLVPKAGELVRVLLAELLTIAEEFYPRFIEVGLGILLALLQGLDENIEEITNRVANIVEKFLTALEERMPDIVAAGVKFLVTFLGALSERTDEIVLAVAGLIVSFLAAVEEALPLIQEAAANLIIKFIEGIGTHALEIITAGTNVLNQILWGIAGALFRVTETATSIITTLITQIGAMALQIAAAGADALIDFLTGIGSKIGEVLATATKVIVTFIGQIANMGLQIAGAGVKAVIDFLRGIASMFLQVVAAGVKIALYVIDGIADNALAFANAAADVLIDFLNGLADAIRTKSGELRAAGRNIASAIAEGITGGLSSQVGGIVSEIAGSISDGVGSLNPFARSGKKEGKMVGKSVAEGIAEGLEKGGLPTKSAEMGRKTVDAFKGSVKDFADKLVNLEDVNPVIAPVLDLSGVESEAERLAALLAVAPISPDVSYDQARVILHTNDRKDPDDGPADDGGDAPLVGSYTQIINSPKPVTARVVYRGTKSLLAKTRKDLDLE